MDIAAVKTRFPDHRQPSLDVTWIIRVLWSEHFSEMFSLFETDKTTNQNDRNPSKPSG